MEAEQLRDAFDEAFDQALVFHGFTDYMRDYELVIQFDSDPRLGVPPEYKRYVFVNCVSASATTALTPEIWSISMEDDLIDGADENDVGGFVWGVRWQCLYPGFSLEPDSAEAARWTEQLGIPFYEVSVETNGHNLRLVFSDFKVKPGKGYSPFVAGPSS